MNTLQNYVARIESSLYHVAIQESMPLEIVGFIQGPQTLTWKIQLRRHSRIELNRLGTMGNVLKQAFHVSAVRIRMVSGGILLQIPSPVPFSPSCRWLAMHTHGRSVAVGMDAYRRPLQISLDDHPTVLFVGPTRKGKTSGMKSMLYALAAANDPQDFQYLIISQRHTDWLPFSHAAGCHGIVGDAALGMLLIERMAKQLVERSQRGVQFRKSNTTMRNGAQRNQTTAPFPSPLHVRPTAPSAMSAGVSPHISSGTLPYPALVIVLDDLVWLLKRQPEMASPMAEIASAGGAVGLYMILGTQDAGSKRGTGGDDVENNVTARFVYRVANAATAARVAGSGGTGIHEISGRKGDAICILDDRTIRVTTGYADDALITAMPRQDANGITGSLLYGTQQHNSGNNVENYADDQNDDQSSENDQNGENDAFIVLPTPHRPFSTHTEGGYVPHDDQNDYANDRYAPFQNGVTDDPDDESDEIIYDAFDGRFREIIDYNDDASDFDPAAHMIDSTDPQTLSIAVANREWSKIDLMHTATVEWIIERSPYGSQDSSTRLLDRSWPRSGDYPLIQVVHAHLGKVKDKTYKALWGSKNGDTAKWLQRALDDESEDANGSHSIYF